MGDEICGRIAHGESLISICESASMPHERTVYRWLRKPENDDFRQQYARAREDQASYKFEEMTEIARHATPENVQVAKLQIDTIKWQASKLHPKVYGERITQEHTGADGAPLTPPRSDADAAAFAEMLAAARRKIDA